MRRKIVFQTKFWRSKALCSVSVIPLPTLKLFCLHDFRQAGLSQRVDCLASRWEVALSVFLKDTAMRYRIGSRTKVLQLFDCLPTEPRRRQFK